MHANSPPVVPANAGTHTLRDSDVEGVSTCGNSSPNNNHRWLWVPAFAGTTTCML